MLAQVRITKECREVHGIDGAFEEACERIKDYYMIYVESEIHQDKTFRIELYFDE